MGFDGYPHRLENALRHRQLMRIARVEETLHELHSASLISNITSLLFAIDSLCEKERLRSVNGIRIAVHLQILDHLRAKLIGM